MNKLTILVLVIFTSISGFAQKSTNSPYSFFGIGENSQQNSVEEISSGGLGISTSDGFHISFANPANLANLKVTTYTLAGASNYLTVKDGIKTEKGLTSTASYFALGFPISNKMGFSFGLMPKSSVGYELFIENKDVNDEITDATLLKGNGGTNRVFTAVGYQIYKDFNVGLEAEYVFGNIENQTIKQIKDVQLATKYLNTNNLNGFGLKLGANYKKKIYKEINLYTGLTVSLENDLNTDRKEYIYSLTYNNGNEIPRDTAYFQETKSSLVKPVKTAIGFGVGKSDKWFAGLEYSFQDALQFNTGVLSTTKAKYEKSSKLSVGGYYTPNYNSISSYWERVTYRAGMKFEQTGLMINSTANSNQYTGIDDFGITFGAGLPIGNQLSNINLGFEVGKRGKTALGLIQENYFNIKISLSLNDKWFNKTKIN
ncbi:MAG: hypothetical protein Q8J84_07160 [Flavobacteriaceae bacterium]|nr:hypothetical protein [Flavobacteriaceae bacterium]